MTYRIKAAITSGRAESPNRKERWTGCIETKKRKKHIFEHQLLKKATSLTPTLSNYVPSMLARFNVFSNTGRFCDPSEKMLSSSRMNDT